MFYERVCDDCGGSGRVDADTGERIPDELMLVAMLREIHRLNGVIADLRRAASDECPIYGTLKDHPGGGKYRGD